MPNPSVSIIVLNYNKLSDTIECIASLEKISYPNYRIIIVDNKSIRDDGQKLEQKYSKKHVVILNKKNLGYAGGNNVGIRYALDNLKANYILIINNDTIVEPLFLTSMVKTAESSPDVGMVATTIRCFKNRDQIDSLGLKLTKTGLPYKRTRENDPLFCPSGACALYHQKMLRDIALNAEFFDEDLFLFGEDIDLGFRGRLRGFTCKLASHAVIYHKVSVTTVEKSPLSIYYGHRNNPLVIIKNMPKKLLIQYGLVILGAQLASIPYYLLKDIRNVTTVLRAKKDVLKLLPKMIKKRRLIQASKKISDNELRNFLA